MKTCCIAQGTLLNALWRPEGEGHPKGRGYLYFTAGSLCCTTETNVTM